MTNVELGGGDGVINLGINSDGKGITKEASGVFWGGSDGSSCCKESRAVRVNLGLKDGEVQLVEFVGSEVVVLETREGVERCFRLLLFGVSDLQVVSVVLEELKCVNS